MLFKRRMVNTEKFAGGRGGDAGMMRTENRSNGRIRCAKATTSLGAVVDMSASGVRVACKKKPKVEVGEIVRLELKAEDRSITLPACVVWVRIQHDCTYQAGLKFEKLDALRKKQIVEIIRIGVDSDGLSRGWTPIGKTNPDQTKKAG